MTAIENYEIKGISAKTLVFIITCTGSLMLAILGTFYSLKGEIRDIQTSKDSDTRYNDLRMKVLEQKVELNTITLREVTKILDVLNK